MSAEDDDGIVPERRARKNIDRFVVDNMVYDLLVETPERQRQVADLHAVGTIKLLMTHVQKDEIAASQRTMVDPSTDEVLPVRDLVLAIPFTITPTYGLVLGISKVGLARFGDPATIERADSPDKRHTKDALLASTAFHEEAVLVTNDRRLQTRAAAGGVEVWTSSQFLTFLGEP